MTDYFEVITDASTGEQTIRPYTEEEIAAIEAANAPTRERQEAARRAAYIVEADPLFFMSQRGEATTAEWEAKVAEIKARYPYPAE
jgi:hypothetical protein